MRLSFIAAGIAVALFMSGGAKTEGIMSGPCIGCAEGIVNVSKAASCPSTPTVTALSPTTGSTAGGTAVTVTGTNFLGATAVAFGTTPATTFSTTNPTTIAATSPAGSVGTVDVRVTQCAQSPINQPGDQFTYTNVCSQATTFLARTSGLSGTETSAFTTAICGMVTDGTWTGFDFLHVYTTNNTTSASLNLVSTSFTLTYTSIGNCTFTADQGLTGDHSTCFVNTNFTPSTQGVNYTANSASMGVCVLNSRTTSASYNEIGAQVAGAPYFDYLQPQTSSTVAWNVNGTSTFPSTANSNAQGSWIVSRTGASALTLYKNGTSFGIGTGGATMPAIPLYVLAQDDTGSATDLSGDTLGYDFGGTGFTGPQVSSIRSRLSTLMTTLNAGNSGC